MGRDVLAADRGIPGGFSPRIRGCKESHLSEQLAICAHTGSDRATLESIKIPTRLGPREVLCRTIELGVCGTDRDILLSRAPWVAANETRLVLGHECLAEVVECGAEVDRTWLGRKVVPLVRRSLDPAVGRPDLAPPGTYIERGIYRADGFATTFWLDQPEHLLPVPAGLEPFAVFTEPQSIAEKAVHEAIAIQQGRSPAHAYSVKPPRTLITGQGPIAFAAVIAALARGWEVTLVGRDGPEQSRTRLAHDLGATTITWQELPIADGQWREEVESIGWDLVLECTGSDEAMVHAAANLRAMGILVWLGCERTPESRHLPWSALMRDAILRNHVFVGVVNSAKRDFEAAFRHLAWLQQQGDYRDRLLTHRAGLQQALTHYHERLPGAIKTIIEFRG